MIQRTMAGCEADSTGGHRAGTGRGAAFLRRLPLLGTLARVRALREEVLDQCRESGWIDGRSSADALGPGDVPSVASDESDRVLAEIDQDGFAFATAAEDEPVFMARAHRLARNRYRIEVVMREGRVCLAKQFLRERKGGGMWNRMGLRFYAEAAALLRLRGVPCVPALRRVDVASRTIYIDYIYGQSLRHALAEQPEPILDLDLSGHPALRALDEVEREKREMELCRRAVNEPMRQEIRSCLGTINARGVVPLDVKPGNILLGRRTGAVYWIDFERTVLSGDPRWEPLQAHSRDLVRQWFG